jgi:hypothetical protein
MSNVIQYTEILVFLRDTMCCRSGHVPLEVAITCMRFHIFCSNTVLSLTGQKENTFIFHAAEKEQKAYTFVSFFFNLTVEHFI